MHVVWWAASQREKSDELCMTHRSPLIPADCKVIESAGLAYGIERDWILGDVHIAESRPEYSTAHVFAIEKPGDVMTKEQLRTVLAKLYSRIWSVDYGPPFHTHAHKGCVLGMPLNDFVEVLIAETPTSAVAWHIWQVEEEEESSNDSSAI